MDAQGESTLKRGISKYRVVSTPSLFLKQSVALVVCCVFLPRPLHAASSCSLQKPMAFFRGTPFCNDVLHYVGDRQVNCSRLLLSEMTREHPDLLNVTLTEDFEDNGRLWKVSGSVGWLFPFIASTSAERLWHAWGVMRRVEAFGCL